MALAYLEDGNDIFLRNFGFSLLDTRRYNAEDRTVHSHLGTLQFINHVILTVSVNLDFHKLYRRQCGTNEKRADLKSDNVETFHYSALFTEAEKKRVHKMVEVYRKKNSGSSNKI